MKDDKKETKTDAKPAPKQLYRVRTSWSDAKSQIGAYAMLENAKNACPVGYKVYASNGKIVYEPFKAYTVRKDAADPLNIRKGPGTNYDVQGQDHRHEALYGCRGERRCGFCKRLGTSQSRRLGGA